MKPATPEAIECPACGEASFLKRAPVYDGFQKVGEKLSCAACRHEFGDEGEVVFRARRTTDILEDDARPPTRLSVFTNEETGHCCRHCVNYVVNPFVQRCALHQRDVDATDDCEDFTQRTDEA